MSFGLATMLLYPTEADAGGGPWERRPERGFDDDPDFVADPMLDPAEIPFPESVPDEEIPDEDLDRMFDGELDAMQRQDLIRRLRTQPERRREFEATAEAVRLLRRPVHAPDFTARVLMEVESRRRFLPPRARRWLTTGRVAVAASLAAGALTIALIQRHDPDATRLRAPDRPLSELYAGVREDAPALHGLASVTRPVEDLTNTLLGGERCDRAELPPIGLFAAGSGEVASGLGGGLGLDELPSDRGYRNPLVRTVIIPDGGSGTAGSWAAVQRPPHAAEQGWLLPGAWTPAPGAADPAQLGWGAPVSVLPMGPAEGGSLVIPGTRFFPGMRLPLGAVPPAAETLFPRPRSPDEAVRSFLEGGSGW